MSDLRIALIAEGPTDKVIIEAALKAILARSFVLTLLQPEATQPKMGTGWCGVLKWCREFQQTGCTSLEETPLFELFDLFIVHLDADVAEKSYADCGETVAATSINLSALPCSMPCPPPSNTVNQIKTLLLSWLGIQQQGAKTVFCIPSKASEAWLAAALLADGHALLAGIECNLNLETRLAQLPIAQRVRKSVSAYRPHASTVTAQWEEVRALCSQATVFHQNVDAIAHAVFTQSSNLLTLPAGI